MQHEKIELRQAGDGIGGQLREARLPQMQIAQSRPPRQELRRLDMRGVEIEAPELRLRMAGGKGGEPEPLAAAQLAIGEGPRQIRRTLPKKQAGERQPGGRQLAVELGRVGYVRDITIAPLRQGLALRSAERGVLQRDAGEEGGRARQVVEAIIGRAQGFSQWCILHA